MQKLWQDIGHAIRLMRRDRRFTIAALATLALGTGTTTAVFSAVYGVLLRPLPYPESDRLVRIYEEHPGAPRPPGELPLSNTTMYAWRARLESLEALAAYYAREYTVMLDGEATRVHGAEASPSLFVLLRARPALGRFYRDAEEPPSPNRVVVLSGRLWRNRFGADPGAIGRSILIEGKPHTIVGVAGDDLRFPDNETEIWTPYEDPTLTDRSVQGGMWLAPTLGRLNSGMSLSAAEAEGTIAARSVQRPAVARELFGVGGPVQVRVERLTSLMTARIRPALVVLAVSVVFVLIIVCANVANLFLSRGVTRQRELAVRAALGANRSQLVGQLLVETGLFALLGGMLGLIIASALLRLLPLLAPADFPRLDSIRLDPVTVVLAIVTSGIAALGAGLAPALRGARFDLTTSLHPGDGATAGCFQAIQAHRLRDLLLVSESALATLLLIGASLLARSFVALVNVDPGYDASNVLIARVYPTPNSTSEQRVGFVNRVVEEVRQDPRVLSAGAGNMMPFNDSTWITAFALPPSAGNGKPARVRSVSYIVTPGYAEALRLRLREGRLLSPGDASASPLRLIVNRAFAREYLSAGPVAGSRFTGGPYKTAEFEIVGVVDDVLKDGNDARPQPEIYSAMTPGRPIQDEVNVILRMAGPASSGASVLRAAVRHVDRGAAVGDLMPLTARVDASTAQPRFAMLVLVAFASLALLLAAVGLYGTLSYAVAQRRRELGIRAALGAGGRDLVALVMREGLSRALVGAGLGGVAALMVTRLMRSVLFGVSPIDSVAYVAAPAFLIPIAFLACLGPAVRAARSDPATVLRD
jgi:putative ABC transport system permease protein